MKPEERMELLKEAVVQKRSIDEKNKGTKEERKGKQIEVSEEILHGGTISVCKDLTLEIMKLEQKMKEDNSVKKKLNAKIEDLIMGEGEYNEDQSNLPGT